MLLEDIPIVLTVIAHILFFIVGMLVGTFAGTDKDLSNADKVKVKYLSLSILIIIYAIFIYWIYLF